MKPLLVLARIVFVGCLWSIIFIEGIRVIMLENWHFDIFWPPHWVHAWNLWSAGWIIDTAKEWAFILIIFTFIPLWLTGWIGLSLVPWESLTIKLVMTPVKFVRSLFAPLKIVTKTPVVVKKKSYKEIRPTGPRTPIYDYNNESGNNKPSPGAFPLSPVPSASVSSSLPSENIGESRDNLKKKATEARDTFSHSLFNLDDDDDFELDFDSFGKSDIFATDTNKNKEENKKEDSRNNRYSFDEQEDKDDYYKDTRRRGTMMKMKIINLVARSMKKMTMTIRRDVEMTEKTTRITRKSIAEKTISRPRDVLITSHQETKMQQRSLLREDEAIQSVMF